MNSSGVSDANDGVCIRGRVLYLSSRPGIVRSQIEDRDLTLAECLPLRDNVSTDEITPTTVMLNYDDRLGRVAHVGFKIGDEQPIGRDAIRNGEDVDVVRPQQIVAFKDHLVLARQSAPHVRDNLVAGVDELFVAHDRFVSRYRVREHGTIRASPDPKASATR